MRRRGDGSPECASSWWVGGDDETRSLVGLVLHQAGAVPLLADDVSAALDLAEGFAPDVIVCDLPYDHAWGQRFLTAVRMPGRPVVPIVAISGNAGPKDRQAALDAGFDSYSVKPLTTTDMVQAVFAVIGSDTRSGRASR